MHVATKLPGPLCALALGALALSCAGPAPRVESPGDHHFCGWLDAGAQDPALAEAAYDAFAAHADELAAVHPVWWRVSSPTTIVNHPPDSDRPYLGFHDARVIAHTTPGGARTKLLPMIGASSARDCVHVHRMINDPGLRAAHVRAVVAIAVDHGYDGVDLDYEHLDRDHLGDAMAPSETPETERRAFSAFVADLARAMHGADKTLSLAVPADVGDDSAYDYDALSAAADQVHIMGYDYHFAGGPHVGPLAPLGWIEEVVSYVRSLDGGRRSGRFLLGVPNYGIVGREQDGTSVDVTACDTSARCAALAGGAYATSTDHMRDCSLTAHQVVAPGRTPNARLPSGDTVFFEDLGSLEERVLAAQRGGLGGIAYWAMGGEPEAPGPRGPRTFFQMVRSHFPR